MPPQTEIVYQACLEKSSIRVSRHDRDTSKTLHCRQFQQSRSPWGCPPQLWTPPALDPQLCLAPALDASALPTPSCDALQALDTPARPSSPRCPQPARPSLWRPPALDLQLQHAQP